MTKTILVFLSTSMYHFFDFIVLQASIVPPEVIEKLSVIGLLAAAVYYLHQENEKQKAESKIRQAKYEDLFSSIQERLFSVEKESLLTIKEFQVVMVKISDTLDEIKSDLQAVVKPNSK